MQQQNLISLFRSFYHLNIASDLSTSAITLFMSILYRANELGFPEKFRITNSELSSNTGLVLSSIDNCRRTLCNYRCDKQWLIKYISGTTHQCGTYFINYDLLKINLTNGLNLEKTLSKPQVNLDKTLSKPVHIPILDHTIQKDTIKESLSPTSLIVIDDPVVEFENKSESEIQNFQKGKKLIEEQYKQFFVNNQSRGLSEEQRNMISMIGSFPEDNARTVLKEKAGNSHSPFNAIKWTAEQLQNGNGGNGKHAEKKRSQIDAVREIWNDDDRLQNRIAMKSWTDKEAVKLSLARIAELHKKTLEEVFIGFERECDYYKIDKAELLDYSIERI